MTLEQSNLDYRIHQEIMDSLDEELEMELDNQRLGTKINANRNIDRKKYFKELLRLQGELVKLQGLGSIQKTKGGGGFCRA